MQNRLFRKAALERLSSPEQLDQLMPVTSPQGWLGLVAVLLVLAALLVWAVLGQVPTAIHVDGVIAEPDTTYITTIQAGVITGIHVAEGATVQRGTAIASIFQPEVGEDRLLVSFRTGQVGAVLLDVGDTVTPGEPVLRLEAVSDDVEPMVFLYVPLTRAGRLEPGMTVQVSPDTLEQRLIEGEIENVNTLPVTNAQVLRRTGSRSLTGALLDADVTLVEVRVRLATTDDLPPDGTPLSGRIILAERRPLEILFGGGR